MSMPSIHHAVPTGGTLAAAAITGGAFAGASIVWMLTLALILLAVVLALASLVPKKER